MLCIYTGVRIDGTGRLMITARDGTVHVVVKWQNQETSRQFTSRDAKMTNLKTGDSKKNANGKNGPTLERYKRNCGFV